MTTTPVLYTLSTEENGKATLTVFVGGEMYPLTSEHPNYREISEYLRDCALNDVEPDADTVLEKLDVVGRVGSRLRGLSERVSLQSNTLLFDGDPVEGPLVDHILRLIDEGNEAATSDWLSYVKFLENLATNPSEDSRQSLFEFLQRYGLTPTRDGHFIAYKAVSAGDDTEETGTYYSMNSGKATVNGVVIQGRIPNPIGAVVEMPRSKVQHDTSIGCSTGLHAGAWDYATMFGGWHGESQILIVKINPRDVVSVPDDHTYQKLRVSRYEVVSVTENPYTGLTYTSDDEDDDLDDHEFRCAECSDVFDNDESCEFDKDYCGECCSCWEDDDLEDDEDDDLEDYQDAWNQSFDRLAESDEDNQGDTGEGHGNVPIKWRF